ncbi:type VI secretion system contractile sheath small subunit [Paraferrimonas sedimenticola]|uniref:Type VI secretion system protein ImpB n=1 Tax=Paraferrimonas sedimenticola TaxID=375674 RepID=A0AA37RWR3_9GAMM|nr:type VI secretion system contractile sheath small subunit [Paraferrimonas sedimenticola]GLP96846.1 type VI secretion system protein ImpB [Paraferrimonas sedimenticola]
MDSGQKQIGRNRAPRVQIEYDVEVYGEERSVELPFVMAVMADLSGKPKEPPPPIQDRDLLEIDAENLDERMKSVAPRAAYQVENKLTDSDDKLSVDLTFSSMSDFEPDKVAEQVPALKELLTVRRQLTNLLTYMDGKSGAEELLSKAIDNPELLKSLLATAKQGESGQEDSNE